jgi:hypothetical protein
MKSKVFTTAWELVKRLSITISKALVIAWKQVKAEILTDRVNYLDAVYFLNDEQKSEQKEKLAKAVQLVKAWRALMPKPTTVNTFKADISAWYGCGQYSGD